MTWMAWVARVARVTWDLEVLRGTGVVGCEVWCHVTREAAKSSIEKKCESQSQGATTRLRTLQHSSKHACDVHSILGLTRPFYSNTAIQSYSAIFDSPAFATVIRFYGKILRQSEKRMEIQGYG